MYGAILGFVIVLSALGIWHLLKRTRLGLSARILLAALTAVLLVWLSVCASILLYQLSDPINR